MRLDLFLKKTHLIKRRELARELCDSGMVRINGIPRKASTDVKAGDELAFPLFSRALRVKVLDVPTGNVGKGDQWSYVEILEDKRMPMDDGPLEDPFAPRPKSPRDH